MDAGRVDSAFGADAAELPRPIPIRSAEASARVIEMIVRVLPLGIHLFVEWAEPQPGRLGPPHHPVQGHERHAMLHIANAHVRVRAREPHLLEPRVSRLAVAPEDTPLFRDT